MRERINEIVERLLNHEIGRYTAVKNLTDLIGTIEGEKSKPAASMDDMWARSGLGSCTERPVAA